MQQFVVDGYLLVRANSDPAVHQAIREELEQVIEEETNPGNNILPRIPELQRVFDDPPVAGALTSLLGPGYVMHPHRYCHLNPPGGAGQSWHKDDYVFDQNVRHHRFRWVMAFYYPQDVTPDMGPTGILPGWQYHSAISNPDPLKAEEEELKLCGDAGTVALVNFDVWHRATENVSDKKRYMLKFMFIRQAEPDTPTWNNGAAYWQAVESDRHPGLSEDVWRWLRGERNRPDSNGTGQSLDDLSGAMEEGDEAVRLDSAYKLAAMRKQAVPILMSALRREACENGHSKIAKNPTNPHGGNPADIVAVHGLSAVGIPAVPALTDALEEESCNVRAAAAATLGNIGPPAASAIEALARCLKDESLWVRRNAAEAIGTIGTADSGAVVALSDLVTDRIELVRRTRLLHLASLAILPARQSRPLPALWTTRTGIGGSMPRLPCSKLERRRPIRHS